MSYLIAVAALAALYALFRAYFVEPHHLEVVHTEVPIPGLPEALDGVRIALLTDFHLTGFGDEQRQVIQAVRDASPDLLCLGGDFIEKDRNLQFLIPYVMELGRGRKAFAVLGNHDHGRGVDTSRLMDDLRRAGIQLLVNESAVARIRGVAIDVAGVDDPHTGRADLGKALARVRGERFVLLLAHSPDILLDPGVGRADLVLSGHTHGGQVRLPVLGPLRTATRVGRKAAAGLVEMGGTRIYISRGLGLSFLPIRFGCRPEVSVLTLRRTSP